MLSRAARRTAAEDATRRSDLRLHRTSRARRRLSLAASTDVNIEQGLFCDIQFFASSVRVREEDKKVDDDGFTTVTSSVSRRGKTTPSPKASVIRSTVFSSLAEEALARTPQYLQVPPPRPSPNRGVHLVSQSRTATWLVEACFPAPHTPPPPTAAAARTR